MTQFHLFQLFLLLFCVSAFHIEVEQQRNSDGDVITEIRKSLDGVEAGEQRFVWKEGQLPRLEDKAWWEKGAEWAANLLDEKERRRKREFDFRQIQMKRPQDIQREEEARFAERARMVMEMGLVNEVKTTTMMTTRQNIQNAAEIGKEEENEELLRVEITFFKNGTRLLDFYNGPLIVASPNGHFLVDYRNGTVKYLEGNEQAEIEVGTGRVKRYATLDDLYMAHGLEFGPRDAADFGRAEKIQQQMKTGQVSSFRADSLSSEEKSEQTAVENWRWAEPNMQQNKEAYWGRPLYGAENGGGGQMHGQPSGQQRQPAFGPFPPPPSKPSHQPSQMQQSASAATGNGPKPPASRPLAVGDLCQPTELRCADGRQCVPSSFQCDGTNDCQDGSDEIGCGSQAAKSEPGQQSSIAQPPSPSPSSWMQSRLQQTQPLSPEERELIRQFQSVQPPAAAGSSRVGNGVGMGNGGAGEIRAQQQQPNVAGGGGGNLLANSGTPTNKGGKPQQAANDNANVPEWAVPK